MKSISMILVFSIILSLFYTQPIYAAYNSNIITSILEYEADGEEIEEAKDDATTSDGKMRWDIAIYTDKLPWNYFHNQVEAEIREKYEKQGIGQKELTMDLRYSAEDEKSGIGKEGELTGKRGRADLFWQYGANVTYLIKL